MMNTGGKKINLLDSYEKFYKSEDDNLMSYEIRGQKVWPYIRYTISEEILINDSRQSNLVNFISHNNKYSSKKIKFEINLKKLISNFFCLIREINDLLWIKNKRIVIVIGDDKFITENHKKYNLWMGQYIDMFKHRKDLLIVDLRPCIDKGIEYNNLDIDIITLGSIYRLISIFSSFSFFKPKTISFFKQNILDKFETNISPLKILRLGFLDKLRKEKLWQFIFRKIGAKIILSTNNAHSVAIFSAANKNNVASIEVQHSLISRMNTLYNSGEKTALMLRKYNPKYIISFGNSWFKETNTTSNIIYGNFDQFNRIYKKHFKKVKKNGLCVISSISRRNDLFSLAISIANSNPSIPIFYKLRPEEYDSYKKIDIYDQVVPSNLKFLLNQDIYTIINKCKYVLGINSTMLFEAACFGCKILVLNVGFYQEMNLLIAHNNAKIIDRNDLVDLDSKDDLETINKEKYYSESINSDDLCKSILDFIN